MKVTFPRLTSANCRHRLTLFGRAFLLVVAEILVNAACWAAAGIRFSRRKETQPVLSLALLAWVSLNVFVADVMGVVGICAYLAI